METRMPVHTSPWNPIARGPKSVQVTAVGGHERELSDSWNAFAKQLDDLMQHGQIRFDPSSAQNNRQEAALVKAFVRSYFDSQPGGRVSFVRHEDRSRSKSGSSWQRIEIHRPQVGDWMPVWEDPLE
jgi:hypothetical protein